MKYSRSQLEKLALNPHFRMTEEQLRELDYYRSQDVRHYTTSPKHPTGFKKHDPIMEEEDDRAKSKK